MGELGNGAKHFVMEKKRKPGHDVRDGAFDSRAFDAAGFYAGDLVVHLNDAEAAATTQGAPSITALELAGMVLTYWERDFDIRLHPLGWH